MFRGFKFIQAYIYVLLITNKVDWSYHLEKLELTLKNLQNNGLKYNLKKILFGKNDMEYLGFWVTWTGIQLINKKVEAIVNMIPPKNTREVRIFIGILIYYRNMWARRSHLLYPLTALTSNKVKFKLNDV